MLSFIRVFSVIRKVQDVGNSGSSIAASEWDCEKLSALAFGLPLSLAQMSSMRHSMVCPPSRWQAQLVSQI